MAKIIVEGKEYIINKSLQILDGDYYIDGIKVGSDDINLTFSICEN